MLFIIIAILALAIGSYTDIKTREVPDWLNYGLIVFGLGSRLIFSLASFNWSYILYGIFGFIAFLALAYIMFYLGQWGGGDSKMLIGLGAIIGLELHYDSFLLGFLVNIFLVGAVYGLLYSLILALRNWKKFVQRFKKIKTHKSILRIRKILLIIMMILLIIAVVAKDIAIRLPLLVLLLMLPITFYLWIFIKAIEKIAMLRYIEPSKITEGDWIYKEIKVDGKYICGPKDLGIEKKQIRKLQQLYKKGKIKKILVKYGIPFVPSFLLAYIISLLGFNPIAWFT